MNKEELDLLLFYCWQLELKTFGQLNKFKKETNSNTNKELLENLTYAYNKN